MGRETPMSHRIRCGSACRASSVALLLAAAALFLLSVNFAEAVVPKLNQDGLTYCVDNGDGEGSVRFPHPNKNVCCWREKGAGKGETMEFCIECDSSWKNCKNVSAAHRPGPSTGAVSNKRAPLGSNTGSGNRRVCCKLRGHYGRRPQYQQTSRAVCLQQRGVPVGAKFCNKKAAPQPARICCRTRRSHALMPPQQCRARRGRQVSLNFCRETERPESRRQRRSR